MTRNIANAVGTHATTVSLSHIGKGTHGETQSLKVHPSTSKCLHGSVMPTDREDTKW